MKFLMEERQPDSDGTTLVRRQNNPAIDLTIHVDSDSESNDAIDSSDTGCIEYLHSRFSSKRRLKNLFFQDDTMVSIGFKRISIV
jgi:hypothetical protein